MAIDIKSFNSLFNEYYPRFVRFAFTYVSEEPVAEDFVSEAFTAYWENHSELDSNTKPQAYILSIIKNKCLNHLKHRKVKQRIEKQISQEADWKLNLSISTLEACDPDFIFSDEIQRIIDKTLNQLPDKTRQIFVLSRFEGLSYSEIAEKMKLSGKSIEYHVSKALGVFRIALKEFISVITFIFLLK